MTFKIICSVLFIILIVSSAFAIPDKNARQNQKNLNNAVTYDGGGRFGDRLICYLHAKWISYHYEMPLLYKPFVYSDQLAMHTLEKHYSEAKKSSYSKIVTPSSGDKINYRKKRSTLFVIPYFPESLWEHEAQQNLYYYFSVDWKNAGFRTEIKKMIAWKDFKPQIKLPANRISVAVHIRRGGGFDPVETATNAPLKLPPDTFYIDQIKNIYEILDEQPLYVYIFTDEPNPLDIVKNYQLQMEDRDILFGCRVGENSHSLNVLQDFFEMMRFECLIRPDSNFSIIPSLMKDYRILIKPTKATVNRDGTIVISEVDITFM